MGHISDENIYADMKIVNEKYNRVQDVNRVIEYIVNEQKTSSGLVGGRGINPYDTKQACKDFGRIRRIYEKNYWRLAKHIIISVDRKYDVAPEKTLKCASEVSKNVFPHNQCIYAVHENHDAKRLHVHIAVNTVNYETGRKLDFSIGDIANMRKIANETINSK